MKTIDVIYHHYPHYRAAVMRCLAQSERHRYNFWGSTQTINGIVPFPGDKLVEIRPLDFSIGRRFWFLKGYLRPVLSRESSVIIVIANPNMPASWLIAILGRLRGKKVLFWTHGWLKKERREIRLLRNFYLSLAHKVLVYGERAKHLAVETGFSEHNVAVIYNSLDYRKSQKIRIAIENGSLLALKPQALFENKELPVLICTARLTRECRFDVLIDACSIMMRNGVPVNVLLVGDGPEKDRLVKHADNLGVSVNFYGSCYDEEILGQLIYHSDLTVSPGKIGLTVIHSLTYGTPAITHGNFDAQMPEVEAIVDGKTGSFFTQGQPDDLARVLITWIRSNRDRTADRNACYEVIEAHWQPEIQCGLIDDAVDSVF